MPKTKISEFSATPGNNTDIDGINIAEGCAPSGINDAIRELMAQLKDFQAGTAGDSFNGPVGTTTAAAGAFTTLTTSSTVTHNGGTANGVAYLNGSKVLTTGSALTFDGNTLVATNTSGNAVVASRGSKNLGFTGNYAGANTHAVISTTTGMALAFMDESSEFMRLTSTGLGIGTSSPSVKLDVVGAINATSNITSGGVLQALTTVQSSSGADLSLNANGANRDIIYKVNATELMRLVGSSGNLGIGTSSPAYKLDVVGPVQSSAGYYINGNTSGGYIWVRDNYALRFGTNDTERMRLDSSGNLGLGVTPSAWGSGWKAEQLGDYGAFITGRNSNNQLFLGVNAYFNGTNWIYANTATASRYYQASGAHYWETAASGTAGNTITFTQAMTLDASGNLGVGTTSPAYRLDVNRGTDGVGAVIRASSSTSATLQLGLGAKNSGVPSVFASDNGLDIGSLDAGSAVRLYTNNTERARITSGGDLLVGRTSAARSGDKFSVEGAGAQVATFLNSTNTSGYSGISTIIQANGNDTATYHFWGNTSGVGNWYLYGNGTTSYTSDVRLKKNIETTRDGYIEDLCKLRVVKYNWKKDDDSKSKELGLIAQEVEQVFPGLVQDDLNPVEEGGQIYKQVKQSVLPFMLLKAIQEQQVMINELKAEVAALKAK